MGREWSSRMDGGGGEETLSAGTVGSMSPSILLPVSSRSSDMDAACDDGGAACIIHTVSKFDTLAGVAIKYGVEVSDIKRLNGLVTDLQMFALKTLQIPLPGRHPPSSCLSSSSEIPSRQNTSQQTLSRQRCPDLFDAFPSLKLKSSSATMNLRGYYRISPTELDGAESFEMAVYPKGEPHGWIDRPLARWPSSSDQPFGLPRKSKSMANFLASRKSDLADQLISQEEALSGSADKSNEKLVRRRQKSISDFTLHTPQKKVKDEDCVNSACLSNSGKSSASTRSKGGSASRAVTGDSDAETGPLSSIPIGLMDTILTNVVSAVRRSSSASNLQDSEGGSALSSIWSLKPDFQALSSVAIGRPLLDSLAKPSGRRNKAAVD